MFENIVEMAILIIIGLFIGVPIHWIYWRGEIKDREAALEELNTEIINKEKNSSENLLELEKYKKSLKIVDEENKNLQSQLNQSEENIPKYDEKINELNNIIDQKNNLINNLKKKNIEVEEKNQKITTTLESERKKADDLESELEKKNQELSDLTIQMKSLKDDFTIIDGIGPKVSAILESAGIHTFKQLADTETSKIREILTAENPRLNRITNPISWPTQAKLASNREWQILKSYQSKLKEREKT